jgi:hypothetical protein
MVETILQHWIFTRFAFPFLLVFFVVFAILERTKILGDKKQINALISFVIGLIFVSVVFPVEVVKNMVLFLTVALITMFVALVLWGFVKGDASKPPIESKAVKIILGIVIAIAVLAAILWATGFYTPIWDWLFKQDWSGGFWTNLLFIVVIAIAIALILRSSGEGKGK